MRLAGLAILVIGALVATYGFGLLPIAVALPVSEAAGVGIGMAFLAVMAAGLGMMFLGGAK